MFTGLISEVGEVERCKVVRQLMRLTITAEQTAPRLKPGDSVAVAGACLTVEEVSGGSFTCAVIAETLSTTRLGQLRVGDPVNLELPVGPGDLFGGHLVTGHVDTVGRVRIMQKDDGGATIKVVFSHHYDRWVIEKGSIAIDGASLTVAKHRLGEVELAIIPTTREKTTIGRLKSGDVVNIEFDQAIKALAQGARLARPATTLSEERLRRAGW